jgi:cephalosporin-C deacetylase-like acetyl esterase
MSTPHRLALLALPALLVFGPAARPQDKGKGDEKRTPGDEMIEKYLAAETDKLGGKFLDGARTLAEWQQKRPRLQREYYDMLGLAPLPEKTPLHATVTGQVEAHGVVVEKLHFQSRPGLYVTANFYRPREIKGKLPAILYVCGHANRGRDGNKSAHQDHGFWFANNGYVCLVLDTLQLGEIPGVHHGTYGVPWNHLGKYGIKDKGGVENRWWWHSAGYTPAGVECWNGVRAIDYLLTRPEVDPDKVGVTGISGGGAATFWIAAADDRVKVAVPVSGMSDLESYVKNKVVNGHCDCMFLYNTYQWDWTTIAALVAPRPMLFANSDNDPIFPMDGNRRIIAKLRDCYQMYGKGELVDEYVSKGGHAYRPDLRVAVFRFLNKHLKGDTTTPVEDSAKYTELPGKELRVFPTDADIPKDALNARIDETFVPRAEVELPEKGQFEGWKKRLLEKLRSRAFRSFPSEIPEAKIEHPLGDISAELSTEPGISVWHGFLSLNKGLKKEIKTFPLLVVAPGQGTNKADQGWMKHIPASVGIAFTPRGVIDNEWTTKSPPNYVERSHVLLGMTVDQRRVFDVSSWLRFQNRSIHDIHKSDERAVVYGHGQAGILAAYAALFEPSIKEVVVIDPPKSHKEGPHFLGVLRVLDIPEALGLLAPTPLTIVGGLDPAFDRTEAIYRLAGAADKLKRK